MEIPEQVVQVGDDAMVKVIDIDLDRRRISLSLKQANEGMTVDTEFDPTRYGMAAEYDDQGYIYPEGFDVDTGEWREGFEAQRETWEREYAEAHVRYGSTSRRSGRPRRWMPTPTQARPLPVPRTTPRRVARHRRRAAARWQ